MWKNIVDTTDGVDPKNLGIILLKGKLDCSMLKEEYIDAFPQNTMAVVGYWDPIDEAWALTSTLWYGPFFIPTHYAVCDLLNR